MKSHVLFLAFGVMSACREAPASAHFDLGYLRSLSGLPCAVALQQRGDGYYLTETANATYGVFVQRDTVVIVDPASGKRPQGLDARTEAAVALAARIAFRCQWPRTSFTCQNKHQWIQFSGQDRSVIYTKEQTTVAYLREQQRLSEPKTELIW
jgi:predicted trehalose synthase